MQKLLDIMAALRNPQTGCPWDLKQDFSSIAPYTLEEAYEVADAIAREDSDALRDELGDLLFQVVFHARMAEESGAFDFGAVVDAICEKMLRRHPHVFGTEEERRCGPQAGSWERIKEGERQGGTLDGIAIALPALKRAQKLGNRAARAGFDWPDRAGVNRKIAEELTELEEACIAGERAGIEEETGDLLFTIVNLARHLAVDAEQALRGANLKFEARFRQLEKDLRSAGERFEQLDPEQLEARWQAAKRAQEA